MARPLLVPTAFVTLLGLAPACFVGEVAEASTASPVPTPSPAPPASPAPAPVQAPSPAPSPLLAAILSPAPSDLVVVATSRSGNARTPSYGDEMLETKTPDSADAAVQIVVAAR
jgi:hypothetical protein